MFSRTSLLFGVFSHVCLLMIGFRNWVFFNATSVTATAVVLFIIIIIIIVIMIIVIMIIIPNKDNDKKDDDDNKEREKRGEIPRFLQRNTQCTI